MNNLSLTDWFEIFRNLSLMIGAGFASYAAYYGAKSWKRQTQFSRKFEVTLELLRSVSWLDRAFTLARSPMDGLSKEDIDEHGLEGAKGKRAMEIWSEFHPSVRRFEDALIDARIFRSEPLLEECGKQIREAVGEFRAAIHFEVQRIPASDPELAKKLYNGRYDTGDENPVTKKMRGAVERLIEALANELRA